MAPRDQPADPFEAAMLSLSSEDRRLVWMSVVERHEESTIAEMLGLDPVATRYRVCSATAAFRTAFRAAAAGGPGDRIPSSQMRS